MKKKIKIILIPILIVILYVSLSIFLSPSSSFFKLQYVNPTDKEHAKELGIFITDAPKISFTSTNQCENLEFWVTKNKYFRMYGMLPIGHHIITENEVRLYMVYPKHLSEKTIWVQFEDYGEMNNFSMQGRSYDSNATVHVVIMDDNEQTLCELDVHLGNYTE